MDLSMGSRGPGRGGASRPGQGEQEDWSKGKRGAGGLEWSRQTGARGAAGLSKVKQEDLARGSRRAGPRGAGGHWQGEQAD